MQTFITFEMKKLFEIIILEEKLRQEKINLNDFMDLKDDLVTKALQMEKQQIIDAVTETMEEMNLYESFRTLKNGEQYYNETFKQDGNK